MSETYEDVEKSEKSIIPAQPNPLDASNNTEDSSGEETDFMNQIEDLDLELSDLQKKWLVCVKRLQENDQSMIRKIKSIFGERTDLINGGGIDIATALELLKDENLLLEVMLDTHDLCSELENNGFRCNPKLLLVKTVREKIYSGDFEISNVDFDPSLIELIEPVTTKSLSPSDIRKYWKRRFELNQNEFEALFSTLEDAVNLFPINNKICPLTGLPADVYYDDYNFCEYSVHHSVVRDFLRLRFKYTGNPTPAFAGINYTSFEGEILFNCPDPLQVQYYETAGKNNEDFDQNWIQFIDNIGVFDETEREKVAAQYEEYIDEEAA